MPMSSLLDIPFNALIWYVALLDQIPDFWRALVVGALLVAVLRMASRKVPEHEVQFSLSFSRLSMLVLAVTPMLIWWLPATRVAVLVDRLQPAPPAHVAWLTVLAFWAAGFLIGVARLCTSWFRANAAARALVVVADHKLKSRLEHWGRRLGIRRTLSLALSDTAQPRHLAGRRRIVLPRAAEHWPVAAADVLIIQSLCRVRKHQGAWHLFAQLVACAYWPVPWVQTLHQRLLADFQVATDSLAAACYQDDLGYRRALRQLEQRFPAVDAAVEVSEPRTGGRASGYLAHLRGVLGPAPDFAWDPRSLTRVHDARRDVVWTEPGEKLAFLVGQAVLVAVLVGGATLQEVPPEVERDYSITLNPKWMNTAFRDPQRYVRQKLPAAQRVHLPALPTPATTEGDTADGGG